MPLSLHQFGDKVDCDYTTASRLLSGERAPSTRLLARICKEFGLSGDEALQALSKDRDSRSDRTTNFAGWLRRNVFETDVRTVLDTQTRNE